MKPHERHRADAPKSLNAVVITVSTSKYDKSKLAESVDDESGELATRLLEREGHRVVARYLISDDSEMIKEKLLSSMMTGDVDVIIFTGGTGLSKTDLTIESVEPYIEKKLEGFGEIFRMVGYQKIGSPAILSRCMAGVSAGKLILCLPGSPDGVSTALETLLPELPHAVHISRT